MAEALLGKPGELKAIVLAVATRTFWYCLARLFHRVRTFAFVPGVSARAGQEADGPSRTSIRYMLALVLSLAYPELGAVPL